MNSIIDWLLVNLEPAKVERVLLKVITILQLVRQLKELRPTQTPSWWRRPFAWFRGWSHRRRE